MLKHDNFRCMLHPNNCNGWLHLANPPHSSKVQSSLTCSCMVSGVYTLSNSNTFLLPCIVVHITRSSQSNLSAHGPTVVMTIATEHSDVATEFLHLWIRIQLQVSDFEKQEVKLDIVNTIIYQFCVYIWCRRCVLTTWQLKNCSQKLSSIKVPLGIII